MRFGAIYMAVWLWLIPALVVFYIFALSPSLSAYRITRAFKPTGITGNGNASRLSSRKIRVATNWKGVEYRFYIFSST